LIGALFSALADAAFLVDFSAVRGAALTGDFFAERTDLDLTGIGDSATGSADLLGFALVFFCNTTTRVFTSALRLATSVLVFFLETAGAALGGVLALRKATDAGGFAAFVSFIAFDGTALNSGFTSFIFGVLTLTFGFT
jgi:hypothetical protein